MKKIFQLLTLGITTIIVITFISCKKNKTNATIDSENNSKTKNFSGALIGEWKFVYRSGEFKNKQYEPGKKIKDGKIENGDSSIITITFNSNGTYIAKYIKSGDDNWKSAQAENDSGQTFIGNYDLDDKKGKEGGMLTLEKAGVFNLARLDTTEDLKTIKEDGKKEVVWLKAGAIRDAVTTLPIDDKGTTIDTLGKIILNALGYYKIGEGRTIITQALKEAKAGENALTGNEMNVTNGNDTPYVLAETSMTKKELADMLVKEQVGKAFQIAKWVNTDEAGNKVVQTFVNNAMPSPTTKNAFLNALTIIFTELGVAFGYEDISKLEKILGVQNEEIGSFTKRLTATEFNIPLIKVLKELEDKLIKQEATKLANAQKSNAPKDAGTVNKFCRYSQQLAFARKKATTQNTELLSKGEMYRIYKVDKDSLILHATDKDYFTFDTSSKRYATGVELKFEKVKS